jgi:RecA/RadA recombinase
VLISTGSKAIDSLIGGGIRGGLVYDVFGESGSGKTQLCFSLAANCSKAGGQVLFVDTAGTFRPERISEIAGLANIEKIKYVRALTVQDQLNAISRMSDVSLVIVDSLTFNFSAEYSGPARHLAVMHYIHELAIAAINSGCAVVCTNMVRNVPQENTEREFLGNTVSINTHVKIKLEIIEPAKSHCQATFDGKSAEFYITSQGISDPG